MNLLFVLWILSLKCFSFIFQVDSTRKALQSQSFGAVGDDIVAPTAADHKRADSSSLIDINGETGASGISRGVEDPFAETSQVSPATSDSWATFNTSPTPPAPPAGYPAPKSGTNQWAESGWGQQTTTTTTSNLDTWSSFGTPSPPKVRNSCKVPGVEGIHCTGIHSHSVCCTPSAAERYIFADFLHCHTGREFPARNIIMQYLQVVHKAHQAQGNLQGCDVSFLKYSFISALSSLLCVVICISTGVGSLL